MRKACEYCGQRPVERDEEIDLAWAQLVKILAALAASTHGLTRERWKERRDAEQALRDLGIDVDALLAD